jgi:disulfide bond formation protein DsbB
MLPLPSPRLTNLGLFLLAPVAMLTALFLQSHYHLEPCPLCIFQRIAVMSAGAVALVAALHNPEATGRRLYAALTLVATLVGMGVAGRHVWLQHLPADEVPECGPGLNYWLDTFPLTDVIQKVLRGSGECAKIDWTFLGFSLPELTLSMFTGMTVVVLWQLVRKS